MVKGNYRFWIIFSIILVLVFAPFSEVSATQKVTKKSESVKSAALAETEVPNIESEDSSVTKNVYTVEDEVLSIPDDITAKANELGKTVKREAVELRTENSNHYELSDGSYVAEISLKPISFQDENGKWRDINTNLTDEADMDLINIPISKDAISSIKQITEENKENRKFNKINRIKTNFRALQVPFDLVIPKKYSEGYSIAKGTDALKFIPVGSASVSGTVYQSNSIHYTNVWNSTDVILTVQNDGIKEDLILKDASAPTQFSFEVKGELANNLQSGQLHIQPAWLKDANGVIRDVSLTIRDDGISTYIDLSAETKDLVFPIVIDPTTIYASDIKDSYVDYNNFNTNFGSSINIVAGGYHHKSQLRFDLSSIPQIPLVSAKLRVYKLSTNGSDHDLKVRRITSDWSESTITFSNYPTTSDGSDDSPITFVKSAVSGYIYFDITNMVSAWVNNVNPNYGMQLFSTSGGYSYSGFPSREYGGNVWPTIEVVYNTPSSAPTLTTPNGGETWNGQHTITWNPAIDATYTSSISMSPSAGAWAGLGPNVVFGQGFLVDRDAYITSVRIGMAGNMFDVNGTIRLRDYDIFTYLPKTGGKIYSTSTISFPAAAGYANWVLQTPIKVPKGTYLCVEAWGNSSLQINGLVENYSDGGAFFGSQAYGGMDLQVIVDFQEATPQTQLKYQIQLSTNNGSTWSNLETSTVAGATSYTYDFTPIPETTQARIRIRAHDGVSYGAWDGSDNVFTIKHNQTPNTPTILSPGNANASTPTIITNAPKLSWSFSDPNPGDTQSQYQVQIFNGTTLIHDSGWVLSSISSYTVPSNALERNTVYNWKVRTKDNYGAGADSPFSAPYYMKMNNLPVATFTSYTNGQTVPDNQLTFMWTYSDADNQAQTKYQIQGSKDNWATIIYDSVVDPSSATSQTAVFAQGQWDFRVRVFDGYEWSAWNNRNLTLPSSFEPNDTFDTAFGIQYGQGYTTLITSSIDVDFFMWTADKTGIDRITLNVPGGQNYDLFIYNSAQDNLTSGIRSTGLAEEQLVNVTAGQTYYVRVFAPSGGFSSSPYTLMVQRHGLTNGNYQTNYQYDNNGNLLNKQITVGN
jgi:hypothetical protein